DCRAVALLAADRLPLMVRIGIGDRDAGIGGDDVGDLDDAAGNGAVVVSGPERRNHAAASVANLGVGQNPFQTVADFNAALAVLDGEEQDDATVGALFADLPLLFEAIGEVVNVITIE